MKRLTQFVTTSFSESGSGRRLSETPYTAASSWNHVCRHSSSDMTTPTSRCMEHRNVVFSSCNQRGRCVEIERSSSGFRTPTKCDDESRCLLSAFTSCAYIHVHTYFLVSIPYFTTAKISLEKARGI